MFCWWDRSKEILVCCSLTFFSVVHLLRPRLLHFLQSRVRFAGYGMNKKSISSFRSVRGQKMHTQKMPKITARMKIKKTQKKMHKNPTENRSKKNNLLKSVREWIEAMGHSLCKYLRMPFGVWFSLVLALFLLYLFYFLVFAMSIMQIILSGVMATIDCWEFEHNKKKFGRYCTDRGIRYECMICILEAKTNAKYNDTCKQT